MVCVRTMAERPAKRSWHRAMNLAWLDRMTRARFEQETGTEPLATSETALEGQLVLGQYADYEREFRLWATLEFGLVDAAPQSLKEGSASSTQDVAAVCLPFPLPAQARLTVC